MNIRQIEDHLIHAERVTIEAKAGRLGPKPLRAQKLPFVHSDADMIGWIYNPGDRKSQKAKADACRLMPDDRSGLMSRLVRELFEKFEEEISEDEMREAVAVEAGLINLVDDEEERRAVLAWAGARTGGRPLKRLSKANGITPQTGRRRKKRAIEKISSKLAGKPDLHDENREIRVLPVSPEIDHVSATVMADAGFETSANSWAADDALQPFHIDRIAFPNGDLKMIPTDQAEFTWAKRRCQLRREREAKRRKDAARQAA
mgnify:CR=1 FL=1